MPPSDRRRTFGNIYSRRGKWRVRYSIRGVRYDVEGGDTQGDAEAVLARVTLDRAHARLAGRPVTAPVTLTEVEPRIWKVWNAVLRPATRSTRRAVLRHYREALPGPMRDVTGPEAEAAMYGRLALGIAPVSVESERRVMASVWTLAARMGVVHTNPWKGARLPRAEVEPHRRLTDEELERLYAAAPTDLLPALLLMGEAGLRRNEVVSLTRADVAADKRSVLVRAAVAKSHKSRRVPLTARAAAAMETLPAALPTARVVGVGTARLNARFRVLADSIGLTDVTPHTLRHTAAHRWAESGVSLYVIRDLLGHASVKQTEVYASRATEDTLRAAVDHAESLRASNSLNRSDSRT